MTENKIPLEDAAIEVQRALGVAYLDQALKFASGEKTTHRTFGVAGPHERNEAYKRDVALVAAFSQLSMALITAANSGMAADSVVSDVRDGGDDPEVITRRMRRRLEDLETI